jgi:hypothetical protein
VGPLVGIGVGAKVGKAVGAGVGLLDGALVGAGVGLLDGALVGAGVGATSHLSRAVPSSIFPFLSVFIMLFPILPAPQ